MELVSECGLGTRCGGLARICARAHVTAYYLPTYSVLRKYLGMEKETAQENSLASSAGERRKQEASHNSPHPTSLPGRAATGQGRLRTQEGMQRAKIPWAAGRARVGGHGPTKAPRLTLSPAAALFDIERRRCQPGRFDYRSTECGLHDTELTLRPPSAGSPTRREKSKGRRACVRMEFTSRPWLSADPEPEDQPTVYLQRSDQTVQGRNPSVRPRGRTPPSVSIETGQGAGPTLQCTDESCTVPAAPRLSASLRRRRRRPRAAGTVFCRPNCPAGKGGVTGRA